MRDLKSSRIAQTELLLPLGLRDDSTQLATDINLFKDYRSDSGAFSAGTENNMGNAQSATRRNQNGAKMIKWKFPNNTERKAAPPDGTEV